MNATKETTMETTPNINPDRLAELEKLSLDHGGHQSFDAGHCAMEAVAWLAGEPHSDMPACACPVIARAMIRLNDRIKDKKLRTELLRPLIPRIAGSRASREVMIKRGYVAANMALHVFAPAALEKRGWLDLAKEMRAIAEITDIQTAREARDIAGRIREESWKMRSAYAADAAYAAYAAAADAAYAADAADAADAAYAAAAYAADAAYAAAADADAAYAADAADAAYAAAAAYAAYDAAAAYDAYDVLEASYRLGVKLIEAMLDVTSGGG